MPPIVIDVSDFYSDTAKLSELADYQQQALTLAGNGQNIILTGAAPVWLYLSIAHALHGKVKKLCYQSPGLVDEAKNPQGIITIFDHDAYSQ